MQHIFKYWLTLTGICFSVLILCPSFVNAQKTKSLVKAGEAAIKRLPVKPVIGRPIIPFGISHSQLPLTISGTLLGTPARQVIKFNSESVKLPSHPKETIPASIHFKPTTGPSFPNLRTIRSHSKPTFAPKEEKNNWFDQWIKEQDLKDILEEFNFDIDWEKERDKLYYAIIIEEYGRAITDAA